MLTFQILVPVLTPDAVPGGEGPSLLELDLFSLMVSKRCSYQLEHCAFTIIEALLPLTEMTHGLSYRGSFKKWEGVGKVIFYPGDKTLWLYCLTRSVQTMHFTVPCWRTVDSYLWLITSLSLQSKFWTQPFSSHRFFIFISSVCKIFCIALVLWNLYIRLTQWYSQIWDPF